MTIEYTSEIGEEISNLLAEGLSMRQIATLEDMPSRNTMMRWLKRDDIDFGTKCARARRVQGELAVDEHKEIIDRVIAGEIPPDVARVVLSGMEWRAKKLEPKKYGDKTTLAGDPENPLIPKKKLTRKEVARIFVSSIMAAKREGGE